MPNTRTKQSTATVKAVKNDALKSNANSEIKVLEVVRRQGIYTGTLQISDVKEVEKILSAFDRNDGIQAKQGSQAVELEFNAKGGRKGSRDYCLRLPNIKLEDLKAIGFTKEENFQNLYTAK